MLSEALTRSLTSAEHLFWHLLHVAGSGGPGADGLRGPKFDEAAEKELGRAEFWHVRCQRSQVSCVLSAVGWRCFGPMPPGPVHFLSFAKAARIRFVSGDEIVRAGWTVRHLCGKAIRCTPGGALKANGKFALCPAALATISALSDSNSRKSTGDAVTRVEACEFKRKWLVEGARVRSFSFTFGPTLIERSVRASPLLWISTV